MRACLGAAVAVFVSLTVVVAARADSGEAHRLFELGMVALEEGRFPDARDVLRRSLELQPTAATVFNLIVALRGTEQPTQAVPLCEALVRGDYGVLARDAEAHARHICSDVAAQQAELAIQAEDPPQVLESLSAEDPPQQRKIRPRRSQRKIRPRCSKVCGAAGRARSSTRWVESKPMIRPRCSKVCVSR